MIGENYKKIQILRKTNASKDIKESCFHRQNTNAVHQQLIDDIRRILVHSILG